MKSNPTTNKTTISKPTKATKNRITALILALLLTATVLIPQIPVKAEGTTTESADISENNGSGGTSAGAGDNLPVDNASDASFESNLQYKVTKGLSEKVYSRSHSIYINGDGHFNVRSVDILNLANEAHIYYVYVFSDKPFTTKGPLYDSVDGETTIYEIYNNSDKGTTKRLFGDNLYYYSVYDIGVIGENDELISFTSPNKLTFTSSTGSYDSEDIQKYIESTLDLSKDDYKEPDETSAVYNKNLDFASISADYKVKYTIEKNKEGHFEFITPDDAGIQFDWSNRMDIDGAYVKFNLYGEYYDSFWSTTYTNTYVTLTCDRKNDLTYLCKQKDMLAQAKEKCNGSKGYGFVVNYIYVQAFANINGTLCRSRIYKFNSDLVSDYGNSDSEDDEWVPEITGGDSMPEDYEPDPENPDPEKTEPEPDKDDDTVVDTPIKYDPDVVINDDVTYLEAFKQFINVMKQGISYLGDFPLLVSKVFSYIPPIFLLFIGVGFAVALLLRFLGR